MLRLNLVLRRQSSVMKTSYQLVRKYLSGLPYCKELVSGRPSRKSAKSEPVPEEATPLTTWLVVRPVKVKAPRALASDRGLICCRRKSAPKVKLWVLCTKMRLSPTALVWLRLRVAAASESPLIPLVNERLGGPQFSGEVEAPVMPSSPSTLVFSEKNGVARLRDRLKV